MDIKKLFDKLTREGIAARMITVGTGEENVSGIMVSHNYDGLYPTKETWQMYYKVQKIARAAGFQSEERGYFTATMIW